MAKTYNQKLKLLHILRLLNEKTDENHYLTAAQLIEELDKEGIRAERKSIYSDIQELVDYGYDILKSPRQEEKSDGNDVVYK